MTTTTAIHEERQWLVDNIPPGLALTGRVKSWLEAPENRLPVSCTVFRVKDSMEGMDGIEESWAFTSYALRNGAGVTLDLSELRPRGTENGRGLVSSGVVSFARFYSLLCEELRRGGQYRNGAAAIYLDFDHPDIIDFLTASTETLPWVKRAVYLTKETWNSATDYARLALANYVNNGRVFLAKPQWDEGKRIYSNICTEVLLPHRGSCLLSPINMGYLAGKGAFAMKQAFVDGMNWLCRLHEIAVERSPWYLSAMRDKQVGLGMIGLANYLTHEGETYAKFAHDLYNDRLTYHAQALKDAFLAAGEVADYYSMRRAFAIAPTATVSYNYKDIEGYTTTPEISPPLWHEVDRNSDMHGLQRYKYPPNVETTQTVRWEVQWKLLLSLQRLMDSTGKAHAISANIWNSQKIDEAWIQDVFLPSDLKTTYYRLDDKTRQALDKTCIITAENCEPCGG